LTPRVRPEAPRSSAVPGEPGVGRRCVLLLRSSLASVSGGSPGWAAAATKGSGHGDTKATSAAGRSDPWQVQVSVAAIFFRHNVSSGTMLVWGFTGGVLSRLLELGGWLR
jgi:hypothetical protein